MPFKMPEAKRVFLSSVPDIVSDAEVTASRPRKRDVAKRLLRRLDVRRKLRRPQKEIDVAEEESSLEQSMLEDSSFVEIVEEPIGRQGTPVVLVEEEICLVPGEAVVRVEDAPGNARRIFTGIDILASVDVVWDILTDYEHLADVIPNLVLNDVVKRYANDINGEGKTVARGARLRQVGAAKLLPGISFRAALTLDVEEFFDGMPAELTEEGDMPWNAEAAGLPSSDIVRAAYAEVPLRRGTFPRPYSITQFTHRDISMQSVKGAPGDFSLYQGVWRLQPMTTCAPPGFDAMRLTYAVELSPALPVPVRLLENRIAEDLTGNLRAIQQHSEKLVADRKSASLDNQPHR